MIVRGPGWKVEGLFRRPEPIPKRFRWLPADGSQVQEPTFGPSASRFPAAEIMKEAEFPDEGPSLLPG